MDATAEMKKAIADLRKHTDDMIERLHSEVKASKENRQKRKAEQHRYQ